MNSANGQSHASAAPSGEVPLFTAVLRPYRSLSPRGFRILMSLIIGCTFSIGLAFWLLGAWPVVGFCGLDLLLIHQAFRLSFRQARAAEEIELTRDRLSIRRISKNGILTEETGLNPYWARLEVDRHPDFGVTGVSVASHGQRFPLASFLGPREREEFANAFGAALARARHA